METTLRVGVVASDVPANGGRGVLIGLLEGDGAGDLGVTAEDAHWERHTLVRGIIFKSLTGP